MSRLDEVLLFSGGLDSLIAWEFLGRPERMYAALGHRYEGPERATLEPDVVVDRSLDLSAWEEPDAFIPMRNLLLACIAARKADTVWLVVQQDEMSISDRSPRFFADVSSLLTYLLGRKVVVDTPFRELDKTDMVEWWLAEGLGEERLVESWSCYVQGDIECGACAACLRKFIALKLNGVSGRWLVDPTTTPIAEEYRSRARSLRYSPKRRSRIFDALGGRPCE